MNVKNFGKYPHKNGVIVFTSLSIKGKRSFFRISVKCTNLIQHFLLKTIAALTRVLVKFLPLSSHVWNGYPNPFTEIRCSGTHREESL